jgi:hypothetical protein
MVKFLTSFILALSCNIISYCSIKKKIINLIILWIPFGRLQDTLWHPCAIEKTIMELLIWLHVNILHALIFNPFHTCPIMQHYSLLLKNFMTHMNYTDLESDSQNSDVILKQLMQRNMWFGFLFLSLVVHRCLEVHEQCFFYKLSN